MLRIAQEEKGGCVFWALALIIPTFPVWRVLEDMPKVPHEPGNLVSWWAAAT